MMVWCGMTESLPAPRHPGGRPPLSEDQELTKLQLQFVENLASTGMSQTEAARLAGYTSPSTDAWRLLRLPHVVKALRQRRIELVEGDLTGLALKTLRDTMTDTGAPRSARLQAAKIVLDLGQFGNGSKNKDLKDKAIAEMTEEELRELAAKLRQDAREGAQQDPAPGEEAKVINAVAEQDSP